MPTGNSGLMDLNTPASGSSDHGRGAEHSGPYEHAVIRITAAQRPLFAYIRSMVLAPVDVEDILQEVNLVLWRKLGEYDPRRPFLTWACSIAHLQVLAYYKRRRRDRHELFDELALDAIARSMAPKVENLDSRLDALRSCLGKLGPAHRQMILKRYDLGGSVQAIADELGRPVASVRVTLHRIRQALLACVSQSLSAGDRA